MNPRVNGICGRLSLRPPQRWALEILARVAEIAPPKKDADVAAALSIIRSEFPSVEDFEREFPSLCFALATGVGKTRLMGAFISYLFLEKGIRHFFVLAPNLTIYEKLKKDFTPNHPKYVLNGLAEFAGNPPVIITGEDYERGHGTRTAPGFFDDVHINIFNISKINSEVRSGAAPRIKRLSEYIGRSYFDYLAGLSDLVLIMDESHRYRADAGVRVLNELKPILGLELTATPRIETSKGPVRFKNIVCEYPLSAAIRDGFVKEPAVATRENFRKEDYTEEQLERLKLEDGVRIHEATKVELETYARNQEQPIVKPFMLVVAQDTTHANALLKTIEDDAFFDGRYKGRAITVHSNQKGEEKDETIQRLLAVESPEEPTEIVVHVNKLKEGWDVTNLYTIVPLRTAKSGILVEQTIGRGLRLPYAKRVGVAAVDRLTIVAHDHFQEIIDEANNPDSIIRKGVVIGRDIAVEPKRSVEVKSVLDGVLSGNAVPAASSTGSATQSEIPFLTPVDQQIGRLAIDAIRAMRKLPRPADLTTPSVQEELVREVQAVYASGQQILEGVVETPDVAALVAKATNLFLSLSIDIPKIMVIPTGEVTSGFRDFDLDVSGIGFQPVDQEILIEILRTNERERLLSRQARAVEKRPEDYLVFHLMDFDDISYDDHAELLYKLAGQVVAHLRKRFEGDESKVVNVLQYHGRSLAALIQAQMQGHYEESQAGSEVRVGGAFETLRPNSYSTPANESARPFRTPVDEKQYIRGMLFTGFARCLYPSQRFDSDSERRFAVLIEDEKAVLKWFKPAPKQFPITYRYGRSEENYEPDFVVETETAKLMCEVKAASEVDDPVVRAKTEAAMTWCELATKYETANGGKPWKYLLIPHDAISATATLKALTDQFGRTASVAPA